MTVDRLTEIVWADGRLRRALTAAREAMTADWAIGGGVIRDVVWDDLFGLAEPTPFRDVDLAYLDPSDLTVEAERVVAETIRECEPDLPWEVTNQARVHLWYEGYFGCPADPVVSLDDAISRFPETCTAVGIRLLDDDSITVIAPLGLDDLFAGVLRRNPRQVTPELFRERLASKRPEQRWPGLQVVHD